MKTLVLCGGRGIRALPATREVPKPLLAVAGRPVVDHLLSIFVAQGYEEFVLAGGYQCEMLEAFAADHPADVIVRDTGLDTETGDRVVACRDLLGPSFFVTYADGLGNVDLGALQRFHHQNDGVVTITTVPLPSPYGTVTADSRGRVERFDEKPLLADHDINAGFMVVDDAAFDSWGGADLERDVLPAFASAGQLYARRHGGFWRSMDSLKDAQVLTDLCAGGDPPWLSSPTSRSS